MKTVYFSETLLSACENSRCHNPEDQRHYFRHVSFKPFVMTLVVNERDVILQTEGFVICLCSFEVTHRSVAELVACA
jgi:hypothetical protein